MSDLDLKEYYYVRVLLTQYHDFWEHCKRNNLLAYFVSTGFAGEHTGTDLYRVGMTSKDALAMKLALPVTMMKRETGE